MTNGVTPRRWLYSCNPGLSKLISDTIGDEDLWVTDMRVIESLVHNAKEEDFQMQFMQVKQECKK